MSPNALGNANQKAIEELEVMKGKLVVKADVHKRVVEDLTACMAATQTIPDEAKQSFLGRASLSVAEAVSHLASAQLILAEYSLTDTLTAIAQLDDAIARAKSPILKASLIR